MATATAGAAQGQAALARGDGGAPEAAYTMPLHPSSGAGSARGSVRLRLAPSPIFAVTVSRAGHYLFELKVSVTGLRARGDQALVAWAAKRDLSSFTKLGAIGDDGTVTATVDYNKFLVLVTREPSADVEERHGPILLQGVSPSGLLTAMADHGLFSGGMPH